MKIFTHSKFSQEEGGGYNYFKYKHILLRANSASTPVFFQKINENKLKR